jgi:hypothetical protein
VHRGSAAYLTSLALARYGHRLDLMVNLDGFVGPSLVACVRAVSDAVMPSSSSRAPNLTNSQFL